MSAIFQPPSGTKGENVWVGTGDATADVPTFPGTFPGQITITNYGRFWFWNGTEWKSRIVLSQGFVCDGKEQVEGDGNHVLAVNSTTIEAADNVVELRNNHNARYSAARAVDLNGNEKCAWGYGNPGSGAAFADSSYWEGYNGTVDLRMVVAVANGITAKFDKTTEDFICYKQGTPGSQKTTFRIHRSGIGITLGDATLGTSSQINGCDENHSIVLKDADTNRIAFYEYGNTAANSGGYYFYTGGVKAGQTVKFLIADDCVRANVPFKPGSYTVGTVPAVATYAGHLIYVTNEAGGATIAYSNGTNWKRVYDNANIS